MNNEEFREERKKTLVGRLAEGTDYQSYAMENTILNKNKNFIEKKTGSAKFSFALVYNSNFYGIWNDYRERKSFRFFRLR